MSQLPSSRKSWRFYSIRIFLFLALVGAADFLAGSLFRYLYHHQRGGVEYPTYYAAEKVNAEVLVMGASRAMQQINPRYIEDSLGLSAYNIGRDGMPFFYSYALLQMVLKRYTPKMIILDCEYWMLRDVPNHYDRLSTLLPLYSDHPEIMDIVKLRGPFEAYKMASSVYPYNSMLFKLLKGYLSEGETTIQGYLPLYDSLNHPVKSYDYTKPYQLDSNKVRMLRAFMDSCRNRNIRLVLLCPPYYMKCTGTDWSFAVSKQIAAEKQVPFIDYSTDTFYFNRPQLFADTVHLNRKGSDIFCPLLAAELRKYLP